MSKCYPLFLLLFASLFVISFRALADPPKRAEAVFHYGVMRYGGDEGSAGSTAALGGTLTVPFAGRWAIEADVTTAKLEVLNSFVDDWSDRRTITSFHLVYRRGAERAYWFGGVGTGFESESVSGRSLVQLPGDAEPTFHDASVSRTKFAPIGYKTGVVVAPWKKLVIRGEVLMQHTYILPNIMARVGVGIRF